MARFLRCDHFQMAAFSRHRSDTPSKLLSEQNWKAAVTEAYEHLGPELQEQFGYVPPPITPNFPEDGAGAFHFKLLLREPAQVAIDMKTRSKLEVWRESVRYLSGTMMDGPHFRSEEEQRQFIKHGVVQGKLSRANVPTVWVQLNGKGRNFLCGQSTVRSFQFYILSQLFSMLSDAE